MIMKKLLLTHAILLFGASLLNAQSTTTSVKPEVISIVQPADSVGLYDKHELRLNIKATFVNPFDPQDIDILATFTSPTWKKWSLPGFYHYTFGGLWKVRFSPDELGLWKYTVRVRDKTGESSSEEKSFKVVPSKYKGQIKIAANNRYLEYKNGTPYFGVGLWY